MARPTKPKRPKSPPRRQTAEPEWDPLLECVRRINAEEGFIPGSFLTGSVHEIMEQMGDPRAWGGDD